MVFLKNEYKIKNVQHFFAKILFKQIINEKYL